MASQEFISQKLGDALIIGGAGFVGSHLVEQVLHEKDHGTITVASRNPKYKFDGVTYIPRDIADGAAVSQVLKQIQPEIIFHVASLPATQAYHTPAEYLRTSQIGTNNLLEAAQRQSSVKAFVYTSSIGVHSGFDHIDADETAPTWGEKEHPFAYWKSKTLADNAVLAANSFPDKLGYGILTTSLRTCVVHGERDSQMTPGQIEVYKSGQTKVQLGDGSNKTDWVYVADLVDAHLLAAKALLATAARGKSLDRKVDGEAFVITGGDPRGFWEFSRMVWRLLGDQTQPKDITVISKSLTLALATSVDWLFWLFTFGQIKPPLNISKLYMTIAVRNATYNIQKARDRLGYDPKADLVNSLRRSIQSTLDSDPEKYKGLALVDC